MKELLLYALLIWWNAKVGTPLLQCCRLSAHLNIDISDLGEFIDLHVHFLQIQAYYFR
jgi:hypothetical protein